jgi:hypothetical protein
MVSNAAFRRRSEQGEKLDQSDVSNYALKLSSKPM